MATFTFNGLLDQSILQQLQQCIAARSTNQFHFENVSIGLGTQPIHIGCNGKVRISFNREDQTSVHLHFISLFDELEIPAPDRGKIDIEFEHETWLPLAERLKKTDKFEYHCNLTYRDMAPIINIRFYGDQVDDYLDAIDPSADMEYLYQKYNLGERPRVIINSIEFIVFEHEDNRKTVLILQYGGFLVIFYEKIPDVIQALKGYKDDMFQLMLHHEVIRQE